MQSPSSQRISMVFLVSVMAGILSLALTSGTGLAFNFGTPGAYGRPYVFGRFYQYDTIGPKWDRDFPYRVSGEEFDQKKPIHDGLTRYYRKPHYQPRNPYPGYDSVKLCRDSTRGTPPDRSPSDRKCSSNLTRCRGK
jgi:hypothetical protein